MIQVSSAEDPQYASTSQLESQFQITETQRDYWGSKGVKVLMGMGVVIAFLAKNRYHET